MVAHRLREAEFTLNANDLTPLYRQLYRQIREQVLSGEHPAHSMLPSIRDLAIELETSRITVECAIQELCAEGYLYSNPRSGCYVSRIDQELTSKDRKVAPQQDLHPKPAERYRYDFHPARRDPAIFPSV